MLSNEALTTLLCWPNSAIPIFWKLANGEFYCKGLYNLVTICQEKLDWGLPFFTGIQECARVWTLSCSIHIIVAFDCIIEAIFMKQVWVVDLEFNLLKMLLRLALLIFLHIFIPIENKAMSRINRSYASVWSKIGVFWADKTYS